MSTLSLGKSSYVSSILITVVFFGKVKKHLYDSLAVFKLLSVTSRRYFRTSVESAFCFHVSQDQHGTSAGA